MLCCLYVRGEDATVDRLRILISSLAERPGSRYHTTRLISAFSLPRHLCASPPHSPRSRYTPCSCTGSFDAR